MSQRTERVDELLRQEIGDLLSREVQDPHIGFATVTSVETSPDLRHAKVWVSVIGDATSRRETLRALERAMGYVHHQLRGRLRIRRVPELHVLLDESAERGTRVMQVLDALEHGDIAAGEAAADAPRGESLPTPVPRLPRDGDAALPADQAAESAAGPAADPAAAGRRPGRRQRTPEGRGGGSRTVGPRPAGRRPRRAS